MADKYPMSAAMEKYLRHILGRSDLEKPVDLDTAADELFGMGNKDLRAICGDGEDDLHDRLDRELDDMELANAGPWIANVLGEDVPGWDYEPKATLPATDSTLDGDRPDLTLDQAMRDHAAECGEEEEDEEPDDEDDDD